MSTKLLPLPSGTLIPVPVCEVCQEVPDDPEPVITRQIGGKYYHFYTCNAHWSQVRRIGRAFKGDYAALVSNLMNKFRGLSLTRTLARGWKGGDVRPADIQLLTVLRTQANSGPYGTHCSSYYEQRTLRFNVAPRTRYTMQGLIDCLAERTLLRKRLLPWVGIVPLPTMFSHLSILIVAWKSGSASADAFVSSPCLKAGVSTKEQRA